MGDLSKDFSRWEFASKDNDPRYATVDAELLVILQALRDEFGYCNVRSGHRSPIHNATIGGEDESWHLIGRAADVDFENGKPKDWAAFVEHNFFHKRRGGLGTYLNFIHVDTRPWGARWGEF